MIILRALAPRLRALAGLGLLLLIGASGATNAQDKAPILVLGDSISAAYGMPIERGWVTLLDTRLQQEGRPYRTVNASISGETSAGGLRRLPELLRSHQPHTVIIELGGNDGLRGYPVGQLQSNLRKMISLAEETGAAVLVLPMEIPPNFGKYYTDAFRASFMEAVEGTRAELGEFPLQSVALDQELMQADGIHPTEAAQPLIMESVWQTLQSLL